MRRIILSLTAMAALAACGDPLRGVPRLGDVETESASASIASGQAETQGPGGLFGRLLNRSPDDPANAAVDAALANVGANPEAQPDAQIVEAAAPAPEPARGGLFGLFRSAPGGVAPRRGPDAEDVEAGAQLAFGQIARVCGLQRRQFGTEIGSGGGFDLYDSNPLSTAPRPFYITGFDDDCARTFTGAVAVAGGVQAHEFVRYQASNERISYTATDNAYEALKARFCRVGRGQPCGARTDRLNRSTQFITVYSFFGGTFSAVPTKWAQILLHDGEVLAVSIKEG